MRTYSSGTMWEVESSDLHIVLSTCYDTASGLIRPGAQLQQLFAPDIEDTLVHLQTRWNNLQQADKDTEIRTLNSDGSLSDTKVQNVGTQSNQCLGNLMNEICEDAFQLVGNSGDQGGYHDTDIHVSIQ